MSRCLWHSSPIKASKAQQQSVGCSASWQSEDAGASDAEVVMPHQLSCRDEQHTRTCGVARQMRASHMHVSCAHQGLVSAHVPEQY